MKTTIKGLYQSEGQTITTPTNPGGLSHDYFNNRFVKGKHLFIPSLYTDNPYLDHAQYSSFLDSIAEENPILGRQWKHGDWEAPTI